MLGVLADCRANIDGGRWFCGSRLRGDELWCGLGGIFDFGFGREDLACAGDGVALVVEQALDAERHLYVALAIEPLPGAADLLARCHDAGCYVAVVSNKVGDNLRVELAHLGWGKWIKKAVGARDAKRDKPAPDPIFMALDGTGIAPDETVWMVGDTPADLKCAHAAGCLPVLVGDLEELSEALLAHPPRLRARDCHELVALL